MSFLVLFLKVTVADKNKLNHFFLLKNFSLESGFCVSSFSLFCFSCYFLILCINVAFRGKIFMSKNNFLKQSLSRCINASSLFMENQLNGDVTKN